jgi:DNA-binding beta-propeller fold protein YncE
MTRNRSVGAILLALLAILAATSQLIEKRAAALVAEAPTAPRFEVDPLWPKPLPNHWLLGQTIGVSVDARDHVWIIHRAGSLEPGEQHATTTPPTAQCCAPAPPVLEFDADGNLVGHWGGKGTGYDWPESNHGITVDYKGNVWIGGNGRGQQPGARGTASTGAAGARGQQPAFVLDESQTAGIQGYFNDSMVLKFTQDGKFLMQIGKPGQSKGSNDTQNLRLPAKTFVDKVANEVYVADGYGNHRVIVYDADTGAYKRHWGAYGNKPEDVNLGNYDPSAPPVKQFRNPVHCAELTTSDRLLYVCDRVNDRIQVFKPDGTFIKETFINKETRGSGSAWDIAFSRDAPQKYLYLADGENDRVHILDRQSLELLTTFGEGGRQPSMFYGVHSIATDSKGNIYTTETYRGQRVQKFVYKGLGPVTKKDQGPVWPKK